MRIGSANADCDAGQLAAPRLQRRVLVQPMARMCALLAIGTAQIWPGRGQHARAEGGAISRRAELAAPDLGALAAHRHVGAAEAIRYGAAWVQTRARVSTQLPTAPGRLNFPMKALSCAAKSTAVKP